MTTLQFNTTVENITSNYDVIIIGQQFGLLNTDSTDAAHIESLDLSTKYKTIYKNNAIKMPNGATIYNDKTLDGYIYLAFGDLCKTKPAVLGFLPDDYMEATVNNGFTAYDKSSTTGLDRYSTKIFSIYAESDAGGRSLWTSYLLNNLKSSFTYPVVKPFYKDDGGNYDGWTNSEWYDKNNWRDKMGSLLSDNLGNVRYAANDITSTKFNDIKEFISKGNPVVMGDDIYNCTNTNLYNKRGGLVYPTSYVYKLVDEVKSSDKTMSMTDMYSDLVPALSPSKVKVTSCKTTYLDQNGAWKVCPEIQYDGNSMVTDGSIIRYPQKLGFEVEFEANVGATYKVSLIFDKNTNGRFNDVLTTDDKNEVLFSTIMNNVTSKDEVVKFTVPIAQGFNGMFSWRVLIEEMESGKAVDIAVKDGYTIIKGDKKIVRVLQILPSNCGEINMNLATNADFNALMNSASDLINYQIITDTIYSDDYEAIFALPDNEYKAGIDYSTSRNFLIQGGTYNVLRENGKREDYTYSGNYSMVVIGFADMYGNQDISDDHGALSNILDFANKGNSVLFTHDTIASANNVNYGLAMSNGKLISGSKKNQENYGYKMSIDFTRYFRNLVGMDKYGITIDELKDVPNYASEDPRSTMYDGHIRELQGINNWYISLYSLIRDFNSVVNGELKDFGWTKILGLNNKAHDFYDTGENKYLMTTTSASVVNNGQISVYPYKPTAVDGYISLARTHGQYFELDLNDPDLVVWYALAGHNAGDSVYYKYNEGDGACNYYIYSKDNITYSGAGHSGMNDASEHKLFVNTIIKAATAGNYIPEVKVTNGAKLRGQNEYVIYTSSLDKAIKVDFIAKDDDLATRDIVKNMYSNEQDILNHIGRFNEGHVYWVKPDGTKVILLDYANKPGANKLLNGEKNTFYVCNPGDAGNKNPSNMNNANMAACFAEYEKTGTVKLYFNAIDSMGAEGFSYATIINHDIFDLD